MARNTKPDYNSVICVFDVRKDYERTKPNLGLTPQQVAEMAKRGITSFLCVFTKENKTQCVNVLQKLQGEV